MLVDSNVILDVLTEDQTWFDWSSSRLADLAEEAPLAINPIVYAEVSTYFELREELDDAFADTPAGRWLAAYAHEYGFALSYPEGGEPVTGYVFEPWHYRFIGEGAARAWYESRLILVEFLELLGE